MNRKTFKFTYRIAAALLLSSIFTFAFVLNRSAASEQVEFALPNFEGSAPTRQGVFPPRS